MKREYLNKRDKDQMIASNGKIRKPIEIYQYTAGDNVAISDDHVISATDTKYTAGQNISISEDNVISATGGGGGTTYTAGDNIQISPQNVISATDTKYTAGSNVQISPQNVISSTDTKYTAGANVQISQQNVISATDTKYTAGSGISIDANNVISATGGGGGGSMTQEIIPWTTEALDLPYNPLEPQHTYSSNQIWHGTVNAGLTSEDTAVKKIAVQLAIGYVYNAYIAGMTGATVEFQCPPPEQGVGSLLQIGQSIPIKLKFNWLAFETGEPHAAPQGEPDIPDIEGYVYFMPNGNQNIVADYSVTLVLYADANNPIKFNAIKARIFAYK
jgi:hypothetical protein